MDYNKLFIQKLLDLINKNNISKTKFCEDMGLNKGVIQEWAKGNFPQIDNLIKISDYFNVSIDYLIGRTNCKLISNLGSISKKKVDLLNMLESKQYSEKQSKYISDYIYAGSCFWEE